MTDKYIPTKLTKYCRVTIIFDGLKLNSNDNDDDDDDDNSVSVNFVISFKNESYGLSMILSSELKVEMAKLLTSLIRFHEIDIKPQIRRHHNYNH